MAEAQDSRAHRRAILRRHREKMTSRRDDEIPYPAEKECSRCGEVKPADAFALARQNRDGLKAHCRICEAKAHHGRTAGRERQRRMGTAQMARRRLICSGRLLFPTPRTKPELLLDGRLRGAASFRIATPAPRGAGHP